MKSEAISLRDLQHWMKWIITDPRGVQEALTTTAIPNTLFKQRYTEPVPTARDSIEAKDLSDLEERLGVYAEAYFSRILESMESDFVKARAFAGEQTFAKLVADYLKAFPSRTTNIGEIGRNFASFISEYTGLNGKAALAEVVNLEWKTIETFYAPDEPAFNKEKLALITDDAWGDVRIQFTQSLTLLESKFPLDAVWGLDEEEEFPSFDEGSVTRNCVLWRQAGEVRFKTADQLEFAMIKLFQNGKSLSEVFEDLAATIGDLSENVSTTVMSIFFDWISTDMIIDIIIPNLKVGDNNDE